MARRSITFGPSSDEEDAAAGAQSFLGFLNRADRAIEDDRRFALESAREARLARDADLDYQIRESEWRKQQALDDNAKRLRIDLNNEAIEANQALRELRIDDPEFPQKIVDWKAKYARSLDEKLGDPRVRAQYEGNISLRKTFEENNRERQEFTDNLRREAEQRQKIKEGGLVVSGAQETAKGTMLSYDQPKEARPLTPSQSLNQIRLRRNTAAQEMAKTEARVADFEKKNPDAAFANGVFERNGKRYFGSEEADAVAKTLPPSKVDAHWNSLTEATSPLIKAREEYLANKERLAQQRAAVQDLEDEYVDARDGIFRDRPAQAAQPPQQAQPKTQREEALDWIQANPNDPRVPAIKKKLGIQ